jgi:hypothetical protein
MPRLKQYLPISEEFIIYHEEYDRLRMDSKVLNANANQIGFSQILFDRDRITIEIQKRVGDDKGIFIMQNKQNIAVIPFIKGQIKQVEEKFLSHCRQRELMGYETTEEFPPEMLKEKLLLEAKLSIVEEEVTELQKRLKNYSDKEIKEDETNILKYGLMQSGQMHDGKLISLDGQKIITVDDVLVIENGPYRGLSLVLYRKLAKEWKQARDKADQEKLKLRHEQAKKEGKPISSFLRSRHAIDKSSLPAFPKNAINYFENEKELSRK